MNPRSTLKVLAGIIGTLLAGIGWKQLHDRQAQHMRDYGDKERNRHGLWK